MLTAGVGWGGCSGRIFREYFPPENSNLRRRAMQVQCLHPGGQKTRKPERQMPDRIGPVWKVVSEDGGSSMKL